MTPNFTFDLVATPVAAGQAFTPGDCLVESTSGYLLSNTANRGSMRTSGVAIMAAPINNATIMQSVGDLPASISAIGAGARQLVRVSTAGRLERVGSPSTSDDIVGLAEADGLIHLFCGMPWDLLATLLGGGGGGTPGGSNKQIQYNSAGSFGGIEYWTRESVGRQHASLASMNNAPNLTFASGANTITRDTGSWVTDGFAIGDPVTIRGTSSNDRTTTITNLSATVMTVTAALTNETPASSPSLFIDAGGYQSYGLSGGTYPAFGLTRIPKKATGQPSRVLASFRNSVDIDVPILAVSGNTGNELSIGGLPEWELTTITTHRPDTIVVWTPSMLGRWGEFQWQEADNSVTYRHCTRGHAFTSDASPTPLTIPSTPSGITSLVTVTALGGGAGTAIWRFMNSPTGTAVLIGEDKSAGAAAWTCTLSGTTATCTGAAFTNIGWSGVRESNLDGSRFATLQSSNVVKHKSGNITTIPDFNGTLPTSSGGSSSGATGTVQTSDGAGGFSAATGVIATTNLVKIGTNPSGTGAIGLANNTGISARNAANSADRAILVLDGTDSLRVGASGQSSIQLSQSGSSFILNTPADGNALSLASSVLNISTPVALGTNPASAGQVRLPNNTSIQWRNAANSADLLGLKYDGSDNFTIGVTGTLTTIFNGGTNAIMRGATIYNQDAAGSTDRLTIDSNGVHFAVPLAGYAAGSLAFRVKSAAITQSSTADTTLSAAQYECPIVSVTGTPGGAFNIIGPNTADAFFVVSNGTPSTLTFKKTAGTGVAIATLKTAILRHNGTDYVRVTADA